MPSIPQSLLWISLVVLWLFVLVPMLINKRDTVRRTSDVALATRVLNTRSRLIRRSGPAAGHRHNPLWKRDEDELDPTFDPAFEADLETEFESRFVADGMRDNPPADETLTEKFVFAEYSTSEVVQDTPQEPARARTRSLVVLAAVTEQIDSDYLDVDFIEENSGALPVGDIADAEGGLYETGPEPVVEPIAEPVVEVEPEPEVVPEIEPESVGGVAEEFVEFAETAAAAPEPTPEVRAGARSARFGRKSARKSAPESAPESTPEVPSTPETGADYEYVEDTSGLEAAEETPAESGRRRRLDSTATAAAVSARKYRFRKRVLTGLATIVALTAVLSFTVSSAFWWSCGATGAVTVLYLAYLRRQTRIEEQVRRRRQQRMARQRPVGDARQRPVGDARQRPAEDARQRPAGEETVVERVVERDLRDVDVVPTRLQRPGAVVLDIDDEDPIFEHLDEVAYSSRTHYDLPRAAGQ
jgi:hypothetical protein